jgi:hypothetical protein
LRAHGAPVTLTEFIEVEKPGSAQIPKRLPGYQENEHFVAGKGV